MDFQILSNALYLIGTGMFAGLSAQIWGVGGGVIIIPALMLIFPEVPGIEYVRNSLFFISYNSLINTLFFYKSGKIKFSKGLLFLILGQTLGLLLGIKLLKYLDTTQIIKIISIAIIFSGIKILIPTKNKNSDAKNNSFFLIGGVFGGLLSGLTGLGGGLILVPILHNLIGIDLKKVPYFTHPPMFIASIIGLTLLPATTSQIEISNVSFLGNDLLVHSIFLVASLTIKYKVEKFKDKLKAENMKIMFGLFLILIGVKKLL